MQRILWPAGAMAVVAGLMAASALAVELRGTIIDAETERPLAARLYLQHANGQWYFPKSAAADGTAVEYKRQVSAQSLEMHTTLSAHAFRVDVPPGKLKLRAERGKEYLPAEQELEIVDAQPLEVRVPLRQFVNLAELGWYSGDVHLHRPLAEVPNLVLAEDLNVALPLSHWVTTAATGPATGNRISNPAPAPHEITVDATHLIYPLNTEYEIFTVGQKPHTLGAVLLLNQHTVMDTGLPPVKPIAERAHADGALLDLEKHSWAWSPVIVPVMQVDFFELANNHCWPSEFAFHGWTLDAAADSMRLEKNTQGFTEWGWIDFGFKSYYAYLNCGLKMQPTAGTGSGVHPVPAGFGRVYVETKQPLAMKDWLAALKLGRSFVTTGPLLRVQANSQPAGASFSAAGPLTLRITGQADSGAPLERVEIIVNGDIRATPRPENSPTKLGAFHSEIDHTLTLNESCWVAVRAFETHPRKQIRFAHSSPFHVEIAGQPITPRKAEVEFLVERVERELARNKQVLNEAALAEHEAALQFYRQLLSRAK